MVRRVVWSYALFSGLWIITSDWVLAQLVKDPRRFEFFATIKGWAFVAITAALLYVMLQAHVRGWRKEQSARREVEAALHASDTRLLQHMKAFIEQAPLGIAMFDREMCYVLVNQHWVAAYGRGRKDLIGLCHYDLFPDLPQEWRAVHRRALAGEYVQNNDDMWVQADGTKQWLRWTTYPWRDARGEIGGVIIVSEDITSWKKAESGRRESEARVQSIIAMLPDALLLHRAGKITYANQRCLELCRASQPDQLIGRSPLDFVEAGDFEKTKARIDQVINRGGFAPLREMMIVALDGTRVPVETAATILPGDGLPTVMVVLRDITERKRQQQAIEENEARMGALGDNLPDSYVYHFGYDAGAGPTFFYISAGVEKIHGVTPQEATSDANSLLGQMSDAVRAELKQQVAESQAKMEDFQCELPMRRRDGDVRWVVIRARPRRTGTGAVVWDGVSADITARRKEEESRQITEFSVENAGEPIIWLDEAAQIVRANKAAGQLLGTERQALLGRCIHDFNISYDPARWPAYWQRLKDERVVRLEVELRAADGRKVVAEVTTNYIVFAGREYSCAFVRDMTERKAAALELQFQRDLLEDTARIARLGGWSFEARTGEGSWTDEVARIHDLDPKDKITKEIGLTYYAEASRPLIAAAVQAAIAEAKPYDLELELVSAKGVHKWVRTIGHPIVEAGRVVRVHGSLQDISELRMMAQAQAIQQRRVALLAEISRRLVVSDSPGQTLAGIFSDLAAELDVDIFANYMMSDDGQRLRLESSGGLTEEQQHAFAEIKLGESLCGLVAARRERLVFADLPRETLPNAAGVIALGVRAYAGHPLLAGDRLIGTISFGSRRRESYAEEDVRLMKAVADQVAAAVERSRLLEALRVGEERFREVVESIQEVFWMSDVAKQQVIYVSPAFATIWGRPCESAYESVQVWRESIHDGDRERVIQSARQNQVAGTYDEIYRIVRPDGTVRWVRDRAFPVKDDQGRALRLVGVAEDITERKDLEERFLRAQRMEALGALASGVAHDLNNILSPMLMMSQLFRPKLTSWQDQQLLDVIERNTQRGASIVGQLLAFARGAEGSRQTLEPRLLVKEMVQLMSETLPRNITVDRAVPGELWQISADPTHIHQILLNLCVNARDAMPQGGRLRLSAANVELDAEAVCDHPPARPGRYVRISVGDTGSGIAPEILDHIFDPFFTTKSPGKGTGLGLSTVFRIIEGMRGFVTVDSVVGRGSEFSVFLPATMDSKGPATAQQAEQPLAGRGELILVVDDEEPIRQSARHVLESQSYRTLIAGSAEEALALFIANRSAVRVVVTDYMMPTVSGLDLVRMLKVLEPSLKVVACSGFAAQGRREEFEALGVREFLDKPFTAPALLAALARVLQPPR